MLKRRQGRGFQRLENRRLWGPEIEMIFHQQFRVCSVAVQLIFWANTIDARIARSPILYIYELFVSIVVCYFCSSGKIRRSTHSRVIFCARIFFSAYTWIHALCSVPRHSGSCTFTSGVASSHIVTSLSLSFHQRCDPLAQHHWNRFFVNA